MANIILAKYRELEIDNFLLKHPGMSILPIRNSGIVLEGVYDFYASYKNYIDIKDNYRLRIEIPSKYPKDLPQIFELDGKIPRKEDFHVNNNGSLCLGSRFNIMIQVSRNPTLEIFSQKLLTPYLYAISYKKMFGGKLIFGELEHGDLGTVQDFAIILKLKTMQQIKNALMCLGLRKRIANKKQCPCGCGRRLGKCNYRFHLGRFRAVTNRGWFREQSRRFP